jgi:hypothetical protein
MAKAIRDFIRCDPIIGRNELERRAVWIASPHRKLTAHRALSPRCAKNEHASRPARAYSQSTRPPPISQPEIDIGFDFTLEGINRKQNPRFTQTRRFASHSQMHIDRFQNAVIAFLQF